ncbi:HTH-type transcriptional repressor KstR2 [bacterium HR33]|nr:HTH-type transcriptional repressor KstR2 [bacterium HR33]
MERSTGVYQPERVACSAKVVAKRRARREAILRAALRGFKDKGYHATTLEDIARNLGVRASALYHYFPDKETILYRCHRDALLELGALVRRARRSFASPADRLRYLIEQHVRVMTETLQGSPLAFEISALSPERRKRVVALRDRYEAFLRRTIEDGIAEGSFRAVDPKSSALAILGAVNWIARWYRPDGTLNAEELGRRFSDFLIGGLLCPALR